MRNLVWLSLLATGAQADDNVPVPALLPEATARLWLEDDPALRGAFNALRVAEADAGLVRASPYEWTARYQRQRRDYEDVSGPQSGEWNAGLERTWRLPGKRAADQDMAEAALKGARADFGLARKQAAGALVEHWLDWLEAWSARELWEQQRRDALDALGAVDKRVRGGDAALLERRLAQAEVASIERGAAAAATAEAKAWARLAARYPRAQRIQPRLPDPVPLPRDALWWQERISSLSDQLVSARAASEQAEAAADRARADRIPDPTIGVYAGREAYGNEKIVGLSFSIPLPGERRSLQLRQQLAAAALARDQADLAQREQAGMAEAEVAAVEGDYRQWQLARDAAEALSETARLAQRAYSLGEQDLQALLLARRQSLEATEAERRARIQALRSYYTLLLDAKLLWTEIGAGPVS